MLALLLCAQLTHAAPVTPGVQVAELPGTDIAFLHSRLVEVAKPTSLQFGPDHRLYVSTVDGALFAYTIVRHGPGRYAVTATERIEALQQIKNHDRDGKPRPDLTTRLVTGILVEGTADSPVIYATSSDPRVGDKGSSDPKIDNHSGVVSRLTRAEGQWRREDLVRGLPRSNEDHAPHGLQKRGTELFIAQGGNTNMGAPSSSFMYLPESELSAAILRIDLSRLGPGGWDVSTQGPGPVEVYASGFRNPYDLLLASDGHLYVTDNGPNRTWGGPPKDCSDRPVEGGETSMDTLHRVSEGTFGGHANPSRKQCRTLRHSDKSAALVFFGTSTNGLAEYSASTFGGAMKGDLLVASFSGVLWRIPRGTAPGAGVAAEVGQPLATGMGVWPLDVAVQGDEGPFPGTIWVAVFLTQRIQVLEPRPATIDGQGP